MYAYSREITQMFDGGTNQEVDNKKLKIHNLEDI